jgi:hypothetical protein
MLTRLPSGFFYGTTTLRRDIGGLTFSESVYRDELHIPEHEHANAFLNLVLEGTYREIGLRMALGANPVRLLITIMSRSLSRWASLSAAHSRH